MRIYWQSVMLVVAVVASSRSLAAQSLSLATTAKPAPANLSTFTMSRQVAMPSKRQLGSTLIRNATIINGRGTPAVRGDVRVISDRINAVGQLSPIATDVLIDAHGLVLAPGFIDTHSHHDHGLFASRDVPALATQGVTTIVIGQDGGGAGLNAFFARLASEPVAVNVASYAGHGTIRNQVMGSDFKRAATPAEVERMKTMVRAEMNAGALGLSTGLEYDPGIYSTPEEVRALAKVAGDMGGRYISHIRSEDRYFWAAVDEAIAIGRENHMPVQISHIKLGMRDLWGQGDSLIHILDRARAAGIQLTADIYPYTYWQSNLGVLYPKRNFADSAETAFVLTHVSLASEIIFTSFRGHTDYVGKTLADVARLRGLSDARTLMALLAEPGGSGSGIIAKGMDDTDVEKLMRWPFANICSDGELAGRHPRGWGSFAKVLGPYARDKKLFSVEEAVRKMTSVAAANMGIHDRGLIEPGAYADLVLFDPATVTDKATFESPRATAAGVHTVWVNGQMVFDGGKTTGRFSGRALRREIGEPVRIRGLQFTVIGVLKSTGQASPLGLSMALVGGTTPLDSVNAYVAAEMTRQGIPGMSIAILHGDTVLLARGYGLANVELNVPASDSTIYQSGSMGKQFTATAVVMLSEQGRLSLDDTITKWLPEGRGVWDKVTIRRLLTHTSGMAEYTDAIDLRKDYTEDQLVKFAASRPLDFVPGAKWSYSNTGYAMLGVIIHRASGKFYGDLLQDLVFKPLGMRATRIISESAIVPNRSGGYQLVSGVLQNQDWVSPSLNTTADGALYYTVRDLTKWTVALNHRQLPSAKGLEEMWTPVRLNDGSTYGYGFGWALDQQNGHLRIGHSGSWQGFKTAIERYPEYGITVIALANLAQATPQQMAFTIAGMIEPALRVLPK